MAGKGGARPNAGRKPKDVENRMRDLVSPYIPEAIQSVVNIMKTAEKDSDRLAASKLIIEYVYGKPKESMDIQVSDPLIFKLPKHGD